MVAHGAFPGLWMGSGLSQGPTARQGTATWRRERHRCAPSGGRSFGRIPAREPRWTTRAPSCVIDRCRRDRNPPWRSPPMFSSIVLALALAPTPARAGNIPHADFELKLGQYSIATEDYRFPSGLRILFQEDHTQPIVSITNWIDRGSLYDGVNSKGESVEGLAHNIEHLAFRARHEGLPKNWDVIQQLGGILNASTSREWTNYMTVAPVDAAVPLLRIEALRLHDAVEGVTEEDVEAEKAITRNELRMGYEMGANGSPAFRTALLHIPKLLFPPDHPYQNSTIGSHETIANIDLESVHRYVEENYRPEYSTIAVVGDFDLSGGKGMAMIFEAFQDVEYLLMAPEDAEAYQKLTTLEEKQAFMQDVWLPKLRDYLEMTRTTPPEPRVDCDNRPEPPPLYNSETITVEGMVDAPTAIVAWSMPGGYCDDDPQKQILASMLGNSIMYTLDPDYDPFADNNDVEGVGCYADIDKQATMMVCAIEQGAASKLKAERLIDRAADAVYNVWAPVDPGTANWQMLNNSFAVARLSFMSDVLSQTDNVASLYGRSFFVSQHAHYTGSPNFFSDSINAFSTIELAPIQELARKYLRRDRMASMIIEPMDEEERERLEASASEADKDNPVADEHRAKEDASRQLFDTEALTPEAIKKVTVMPDVDEMRAFTLDNGLSVVIMDHGEAPLVKVGLQVKGDDATAPRYGLDSFAWALYSTGEETATDPTAQTLRVAGTAGYRDRNTLYASGSSGNLDALLEKIRWNVEDYDWQMAGKSQTIKKWASSARRDGEEPETWASRMSRERVLAGSPYGEWLSPQEYRDMDAWGLDDVKSWVFTKWQPANAYLVIVGNLDDVDAAEQQVHAYFDSWRYRGSGTPGAIEPPPPPAAQPDRQVLLFDKPIATQSKVQLACQLHKEGDEDVPTAMVIQKAMTFKAFERLREEKGLTYGAYAYPQLYDGDTAELFVASVIQNSGAAYGVQTMLDIVAEAAEGAWDEGFIRTNKWNVARTMVSTQQSGDQMLSTILRAGRDNLDYFRNFPDWLAAVDADDIAEAMSTCQGHEVVTVVGPVEEIAPQFDEAGIPYEVVDWKALQESLLTPKELKAWRKKLEEEAARDKSES
ncbi:MAG: insulinase family protein [Deltaproteobacteria bacterium]|nr:MAG: insulinase family protein [Deltaproteobacteria bacterium]